MFIEITDNQNKSYLVYPNLCSTLIVCFLQMTLCPTSERKRKLPFDDKLSPLTFGHRDQHVPAKHITPTVYVDVSLQTEIVF